MNKIEQELSKFTIVLFENIQSKIFLRENT